MNIKVLRVGLKSLSILLIVIMFAVQYPQQRTVRAGINQPDVSITTPSGETGGGQAHNTIQPSLTLSYIIALQGYYPNRFEGYPVDGPMIGEIRLFGGNYAPGGWAYCNGQLLPIASYTALFSVLGTTYGGDGQSTFALPDLRGRAPVGTGTGPGSSVWYLGQRSGSEGVTLNLADLPYHTHSAPQITVFGTGGSTPHLNLQPSLAINFLVATEGYYPTFDSSEFAEGPFLGEIRMFAGNYAPSGYALAYGQLLSPAENAALFSVLGTNFGGDGVNTFALPNLQGRTPVGTGAGPALTNRVLGQTFGSEWASLDTTQIPSHAHTIVDGTTTATGNMQAHSNVQPSLALNFRISAYGYYPPSDGGMAPDPMVGEVRILSFDQGDFAQAAGQEINIQTNVALYSIYGTIYGGNGVTTFAYPDLRGRLPVHQGQGTGLSNRFLGSKYGTETEILTVAQMPVHSHLTTGALQCGGTGTYTFSTQANVVITVTDTGSNLGCLYVEQVSGNHPNATNEIMTGNYWIIRAYQSDKTTPAAEDFSLNLTLPHNVTLPSVCQYKAAIWNCAVDASTSGTVTRTGIASLSDWAVGDDAIPASVKFTQVSATSRASGWLFIISVLVLPLLSVISFRIKKSQ